MYIDGAPSTTLEDSDGNLLEPIPLLSVIFIAYIKGECILSGLAT
jgi:hypothetical protein